MPETFATIGLFGKYKDPSVRDAVNGLTEYLRYRGVEVLVGNTTADEIVTATAMRLLDTHNADHIDLGIVIGGDGTMLHVARTLAPRGIPVVGVNMGRLGFLTDIPLDEMYESIGRILDGAYQTESRMMLEVEVWRGDTLVLSDSAFNDMVMGKGNSERLIDIQIYIDGAFVMETRSDGVIVGTPTGSTAYALSAGGPILHPQLDALVLVPICPHTLSMRPIVLNDSSVVDFTLGDASQNDAHVSFDGQIKYELEGTEKIRVKRADNSVRLLRTLENNDYAALRSKLGWGEGL